MGLFNSERRKYPRISSIDTVEFVAVFNSAGDAERPKEEGVTMDVCSHGVCIYTAVPLKEGQRIDIVKGTPPSICSRATVKWVRRSGDELYKAGLMLIEQ